MSESPQAALARLSDEHAVSLSALSRMLGRNVAYLQQFVGRGSPRRLGEGDRRVLAGYFGVDEDVLGADADAGAAPRLARVPYLSVAASAGTGAVAGEERVVRHEHFAIDMLRSAGVAIDTASLIDAAGDSMTPTIRDGDRLLVDRADRRVPAAGAIVVLRIDDNLSVKRVHLRGDRVEIVSDNPAYPVMLCPRADVAIVGRVKLLVRVP